MGWQTEVVIQLLAGNTIINPNGMFVYSGTPATGNLLFTIAPASTTQDGFGNTVVGGGAVAYGTGDPGNYAELANAELLLFAVGAAAAASVNASAAGNLTLNSGLSTGGDAASALTLLSAVANDGTHSIIELTANRVQLPAEIVATGSGTIQIDNNVTITGTTITAASATAVNFDNVTMDIKNGNVNLNMAAPPNAAAVIAGTATQAQYNACLGGMLNSMTNRQLFA